MSPGGSVGLAPAASQQMNSMNNMYNSHNVPPATSTPVVHSNPHTASIQSILMQQQPASVSNAGNVSNVGNMGMAPLTNTNVTNNTAGNMTGNIPSKIILKWIETEILEFYVLGIG